LNFQQTQTLTKRTSQTSVNRNLEPKKLQTLSEIYNNAPVEERAIARAANDARRPKKQQQHMRGRSGISKVTDGTLCQPLPQRSAIVTCCAGVEQRAGKTPQSGHRAAQKPGARLHAPLHARQATSHPSHL
jgi:hypothetical protein